MSNPAYCLYFLIKSDMRNFWKIIGISTICSLFFVWYLTQAATGDTTGTGNITTGTISTGNTTGIQTTTGNSTYTWPLLTYLNEQENGLSLLLSTTYAQLYSTFSKTWLNILKSIEYQSLVCLWAIKDVSLLSQLQKDKMTLTIAFKKDFVDLENQILDLEEKHALQVSDNVNVFDSGTTYESEKAKIKDLIDEKVRIHKWFINNFATSYVTKNNDFLTTFLQYSTANKTLINGIKDKMTKVQVVIDAFSWIESTITAINAKFTGLNDLLQKMEDSKIAWLANLDQTIQPLIDSNVKKYVKLQTFIDDLTKQKTYVVNQYQSDFDQYLADNFQTWYSRSWYLDLKNQVNVFKAKFYTITNQLNCTSILSINDEGTALLAKINAMRIVVNSWLAKIESGGINPMFKDQLYSGFQSLYIQKFKQRYTEYSNYIKNYITTMLENLVGSLVPTPTPSTTGTVPVVSSPVVTVPPVKVSYVFTKPFKSGEYGEGVKALQTLLTTIKLYSWTIDSIYNKATKNAVYRFQLSKWLLKGYEKKPSVWWWMGPTTRNSLNLLTK